MCAVHGRRRYIVLVYLSGSGKSADKYHNILEQTGTGNIIYYIYYTQYYILCVNRNKLAR